MADKKSRKLLPSMKVGSDEAAADDSPDIAIFPLGGQDVELRKGDKSPEEWKAAREHMSKLMDEEHARMKAEMPMPQGPKDTKTRLDPRQMANMDITRPEKDMNRPVEHMDQSNSQPIGWDRPNIRLQGKNGAVDLHRGPQSQEDWNHQLKLLQDRGLTEVSNIDPGKPEVQRPESIIRASTDEDTGYPNGNKGTGGTVGTRKSLISDQLNKLFLAGTPKTKAQRDYEQEQIDTKNGMQMLEDLPSDTPENRIINRPRLALGDSWLDSSFRQDMKEGGGSGAGQIGRDTGTAGVPHQASISHFEDHPELTRKQFEEMYSKGRVPHDNARSINSDPQKGGGGFLHDIKRIVGTELQSRTPSEKGAAAGKKNADAADLDQPDRAAADAGRKAAPVDPSMLSDLSGDPSEQHAASKKAPPPVRPQGAANKSTAPVELQAFPGPDPETVAMAKDAPPAAVAPAPAPPVPGSVGGGAWDAMKSAGSALASLPGKMVDQAFPTGAPAPASANAPAQILPAAEAEYQQGRAPQGGVQGAAHAMVPHPAAAPAMGGSASASMKSSASGGAPVDAPPGMPDRTLERDRAYAQAEDARRLSGEAMDQGAQDQTALMKKGMASEHDFEIARLKQQEAFHNDMSARAAAHQKTVDEITSPNKVDPDHWWNSRSTAQKIFAVLSAAASKGATLGMFQHAIDNDIAAQQADISNTRAANQAKAQGQLNGMQIAHQNGMDDYEAIRTNRSIAWDQIDRQAKAMAANTQSQVIKANLMETSAIAQQQKIKEETDGDNHRQLNSLEAMKIQNADRHAKATEAAAWAKANRVGAPKVGKAMEPAMKAQVIAADEGIKSVDRMLALLGPESSIIGGLVDEGAKHIPKFSANRRSKAFELEKRSAERALDNSAVQKADQEFFHDKFGGVGTNNWTQDELKNLRKKFVESKQVIIDTNEKAGSNVSGFKGPVELSDEEVAKALGAEDRDD